MSKPFIPFAKPAIGEDEIAAVTDAMRSGWLTTGPITKQFETDFSQFVGCRHSAAVNSATAGLHLALEAIGIRPGDKVLTSPFTFTATAEVIRYLGADPVFVDIDPVTLNIDVNKLADIARQTPGVKAIMPVHFAGQACEMDAIVEIARRHDLKIVEDAAHALPTTYKGRTVGTIGDITVFSFYATKTITTGEGGMVSTDVEEYAKRMKTMRLHGINRDVFDRYTSKTGSWYYEVVAPGFKYNLTDVASAMGICQLAKSRKFQAERQAIAQRYTAAFADLPFTCPTNQRPDDIHAWHLYVLQLNDADSSSGRDDMIERLREEGIGTSVHFIPLHLQPYWRDRYALHPENFPVATRVFNRCLSLPIWHGMTDDQVERVIDAVRRVSS